MLIKKIFSHLLCLIFCALLLHTYSDIGAQELPDEDSNKPMVDTIDYEENLLDSNEVYKQQFDSLSKDGEWIKVKKSDFVRDLSEDTGEDLESNYPPTGEVIYIWRPYCANAYWNPYYEGRWVFSRYGWMWISYHDWGWGPYNYGRWFCSNIYGWIWLPGSIWAANWVTWRHYNNYVGWYPTCPRIYWRNYNNNFCTNRLFAYIPKQWVFVSTNNFLKTIDKNIVVSSNENAGILKNSQKIKTSVYTDPAHPKFKYSGPNVHNISKETGEKISPKQVEITRTKEKQFTNGNTVSTYKTEPTIRAGNHNSKTNKSEIEDKTKVKRDNSSTKPGEKKSSTYTGTKKTGNKQNKGSIYKEGSNESNSEKSYKGSNESNTEKNVEKSGNSNSNNDSVKKDGNSGDSKK